MNSNAKAYFSQTLAGESRWWSWLMAFWFTIVGWVIAQNFIAGPIPEVIKPIAPDVYDQFYGTIDALLTRDDIYKIGLYFAAVTICTILGALFWLIHRTTQGTTRRVMAWLTGVFCSATVVFAVLVFPMINDPQANALMTQMLGLSPFAYALMLATFPALLVGLFMAQKFIHKRTILKLHTAGPRFDIQRAIFAIGVTWLVLGSVSAIGHFSGMSPLALTFDSGRFFQYALVTILFIPLQSATEEIVFRGYLNQGLGHFIKNKWVVFVITSVLFASMHLANPEAVSGAEQGALTHILVMSSYFLFGFVLSVIVYFEGGLEAAIGVHAGNNMFAAMLVNYEGSVLPTPSIFLAGTHAQYDAIFAIAALAAIAVILYLTRRDVITGQKIRRARLA